MDVPVLVQPLANGRFRARTGEPLNLSAEANTAEAALADVRRQWEDLVGNGARLEALIAPPANPWARAAGCLKDHPRLDEWKSAMAEYRNAENARFAAEDAQP